MKPVAKWQVKVPRRNRKHEKTLRTAPKTKCQGPRRMVKEEEATQEGRGAHLPRGLQKSRTTTQPVAGRIAAAATPTYPEGGTIADPTHPPRGELRGGGVRRGGTTPTIREHTVHDAQSVHPPPTAEDTRTKATTRRGITIGRSRIITTIETTEEETIIETNRQEIGGAEAQEDIKAGVKQPIPCRSQQ